MFEIVKEFEKRIADYYNAPFAVATDSCTHALELSFRYDRSNGNISNPKVTLPTRTYVSVPMTLMKLDIPFSFVNIKFGQFLLFNQNLPHGNTINKTKETRVSMNCRFKGLFTPYSQKKLGSFFKPLNLKPATKIGLNYKFPDES